jgi:phage shock protein C
MVRSFTDRVLSGVCGGLGAGLRLNPWLIRLGFVILTPLSLGAFAVLYVLLWWTLPQESLVGRRRRNAGGLLVFALLALTIALWVGRLMGWLRTPAGVDLYWPSLALLLAAVFFLRQLRRGSV